MTDRKNRTEMHTRLITQTRHKVNKIGSSGRREHRDRKQQARRGVNTFQNKTGNQRQIKTRQNTTQTDRDIYVGLHKSRNKTHTVSVMLICLPG